MPTIELVSIHGREIPTLPAFATFAYLVEPVLESHRALFQPVFDQTEGVIVHLANKQFEQDEPGGGWFAGCLVEWEANPIQLPLIDPEKSEQWWGADQADRFRFKPEVLPEVQTLIELLLTASPCGQMYFSTDYQFGPEKAEQRTGYTVQRFLDEHNQQALRWNCLYGITNEPTKS